MASEWQYRKYLPEYNDRYEIDKKFKEAFTILKDLGAKVPDEFYESSRERYKKEVSLKK